MPDQSKISKVVGPPGTGKTTWLLGLVAEACKRYDPEKIGCVSYTNAAIETIVDRISRTAGVSNDTVHNARTLHSHCFRLLEIKKDQIADSKIKEWNDYAPQWKLPLKKKSSDEDNAFTQTFTSADNMKIHQQVNILRNTMIPESEWPPYLRKFYDDWTFWMDLNGYIDFTGMLEKTLKEELSPDIDILFVDECQDLSALQVRILLNWSKQTVSTLFVGDSDQAIFKWAGAYPEAFMSIPHKHKKILDQSYRVPHEVHAYAQKIIAQAKNREEILYNPTEVEGRVQHGLLYPDLSLDGTHMILTRCGYHLNRWKQYLRNNRHPWHNPYRPEDPGWNPTKAKAWKAAATYVKLKNLKEVSANDLLGMIEKMKVDGNLKRGAKTEMKTRDKKSSLNPRITMFDLYDIGIFTESFLNMEKRISDVVMLSGESEKLIPMLDDEKIISQPSIIIGTIHSAKGGEADHVWLDTSTSSQCLQSVMTDENALYDEARVAYVGVTRARQSLGLISSPGIKNPLLI